MIVTIGSNRGSPGSTSWSLLLAAAWPAEYGLERVVVEADAAGGVIGARYGLGVDPGTVSLTAGLRRSDGAVPVEAHGRLLAEGLWVVPGPESAEQAAGLWENSARDVADRLVADERLWLVDAGRLTSDSPATAFASRSLYTVLVSSSATEHLVAIPSRVNALQSACGARLGVLLIGPASNPAAELRTFLGVSDVWTVDHLPDLADTVGAVMVGKPRARRSLAWRQAVSTASEIARLVIPQGEPRRMPQVRSV